MLTFWVTPWRKGGKVHTFSLSIRQEKEAVPTSVIFMTRLVQLLRYFLIGVISKRYKTIHLSLRIGLKTEQQLLKSRLTSFNHSLFPFIYFLSNKNRRKSKYKEGMSSIIPSTKAIIKDIAIASFVKPS